MKLTKKIGLSYYTLNLNAEQTAYWKSISKMDIPRFRKQEIRKAFIRDLYIDQKLGGYDNAVKALKSLDMTLTAISPKIK